MPSSAELDGKQLEWVDLAKRHGGAVVVLEADTGMGKTFVAQRLYDLLASSSKGKSYWRPGLTPQWPQDRPSRVEGQRKTIIPVELTNSDAKAIDYIWLGLPLGEIDHTGRIDNESQVFQQLVSIHRDCLRIHASKARRGNLFKAFRHTAWMALKTALGFIGLGALVDVVAGAEDSSNIVSAWRDAFREPESREYEKARQSIMEKLVQIRDLALDDDEPLIIVLDDAHAVTPEVLDVISLITNISTTSKESWEPPQHNIPFLVVATTWPGESQARNGLFDKWLESTRKVLGKAVEEIKIDELDRETAEGLLRKTKIPELWQERTYEKISKLRRGHGVNALVLANAVAFLEDQLAGGATDDDLERLIDEIETTPEFHIQQRLENLRDEEFGREALQTLIKAAHWGARAPVFAIEQIADDATRVLELLKHKKLIALEDGWGSFDTLSFQIDVYGYISKQYADQRTAVAAIAPTVRHAFVDHLRTVRPLTAIQRTDATQALVRSASLNPIPTFYTLRDTPQETFDSSEIPADDGVTFLYMERSGAYNLPRSIRTRLNYFHLLSSIANQEYSDAAVNAALRMEQIYRELPEPMRRKYRSEIVRTLRAFAPHHPTTAIRFSRLVNGNTDEALGYLERHAPDHADVANRLASMVEHDDLSRAISVLEPHVSTHVHSAIRVARWQPERAEKILGDMAKTYASVAIELSRHVSKTKSIKLLSVHASSNPEAAFELSNKVSWQEAEKILSRHLSNKKVALRYSDLLVRKARQALRPHKATSPDAAALMYALSIGTEAEQELKKFVETGEANTPTTRQLKTMLETRVFLPATRPAPTGPRRRPPNNLKNLRK